MTSMCVCKVTSVLSDRLPCPWDSPGKNTGVGCHFLLQGIFPTQGSNPGLLCLLQWQVGSLAPVAPGEPPQRQPDESKNYPRSLAPQSFPKVLKEERKKQNKTYLISRRRKWQPTPGSLPENSVDQEPGGVQSISVQSLRRVWVLWPHGLQHTRLPVHHQLPELTQTHVHWVADVIQPSHLLSPPSPPAFDVSQHQDVFKASVLCIR